MQFLWQAFLMLHHAPFDSTPNHYVIHLKLNLLKSIFEQMLPHCFFLSLANDFPLNATGLYQLQHKHPPQS